MARVVLVLASASSERRRILHQAGVDAIARPSELDEDAEGAGIADPSARALHLATRKARDVAGSVDDGLVLGADSVLVSNGQILDKAREPSEVLAWWQDHAGRQISVATGHCLVRAVDGMFVTEVVGGQVEVAAPTAAELRAYAGFDSVRGAAGAFVLEGPSAPFATRVTGDAGAISGLSMPAVRRLLMQLGYDMSDLWTPS